MVHVDPGDRCGPAIRRNDRTSGLYLWRSFTVESSLSSHARVRGRSSCSTCSESDCVSLCDVSGLPSIFGIRDVAANRQPGGGGRALWQNSGSRVQYFRFDRCSVRDLSKLESGFAHALAASARSRYREPNLWHLHKPRSLRGTDGAVDATCPGTESEQNCTRRPTHIGCLRGRHNGRKSSAFVVPRWHHFALRRTGTARLDDLHSSERRPRPHQGAIPSNRNPGVYRFHRFIRNVARAWPFA